MIDLWIDANILLRFLTGEPTELANRALRLFERADRGEVRLHVSPMIVAETVWVLTSFYKYPKAQIRDVLQDLLSQDGMAVEQMTIVLATLEQMAVANVDFVDAYLAELVRENKGTIASFDRDFRRLNIDWISPE
jgi:predicted nucleic acid-binding protein